MDGTIGTDILSLISDRFTYFLGSPSTFAFAYANGSTSKVQVAQLFGYAGAAVAFFFSISGALQAGSKTILYLEAGFWDFLSDF